MKMGMMEGCGEGRVTWRHRAAQVVEELFPVAGVEAWDDLLDLRQLLLKGGDWGLVVDQFLACRERLERDHYLLMYRLRRLLEGHLRLVTSGGAEAGMRTMRLALWRHQGLADLHRRAQRDHWEQGTSAAGPGTVRVEVVEREV